MSITKSAILLKQEIRRSFNQAVDSYDQAAFLQREVANRLLERLDYIRIEPRLILDLGSGTGYSVFALQQRYKKARVIAFDLADQMLSKMKKTKRWFDRTHYICGDAENLPFADNSVDLIFSNLMLQWCDPWPAITEINRVLKPEGLLLFTSLGPDSLYELRQSWQAVDQQIHVHPFIDMHVLGDYLQACLKDVVMDMEFITITYNELRKLLIDLKDLGTHNIAQSRARGLTGKTKFSKFVTTYESYRNPEGLIPLTYEIIYGLGWGKSLQQQNPNELNEVYVAVPSIKNSTNK